MNPDKDNIITIIKRDEELYTHKIQFKSILKKKGVENLIKVCVKIKVTKTLCKCVDLKAKHAIYVAK